MSFFLGNLEVQRWGKRVGFDKGPRSLSEREVTERRKNCAEWT